MRAGLPSRRPGKQRGIFGNFLLLRLWDMVEYRPTSPWTVDRGRVAQLVEQRTENPRVEGSSPPPTTIRMQKRSLSGALFCAPGCCRAAMHGCFT